MLNHAVPVCHYSFAGDFLRPVARAGGRIAGAGPSRQTPTLSHPRGLVRPTIVAVFQAATRSGLRGNNYLLSSESYRISDLSLMLNQQPPAAEAALVYGNTLATSDLALPFRPALETLQQVV